MQKIEKYIRADICAKMARDIEEAGGNEVFFLGHTDDSLCVVEVELLARGNRQEVAAIVSDCRPGDVVLHNHPSGHLQPSTADNRIASALGNEAVGFIIINNAVTHLYVVAEPRKPREAVPVDIEALRSFLQSGGPLAQELQNFEQREPQIQMLDAVGNAFNENKIAMIEAGTGTGKTLAYLLPAIRWSKNNSKRVVLSTNTINLQQQLIEKDIPLLQRIFPEKFTATLVKGRGNYLCLRKLNEALSKPAALDLDESEQELVALQRWSQKSKDGSLTDLSFTPADRVWEQVRSESDTTLKKRCEFYDRCFFYNARRNAATADILVVNHHVFFADMAVRTAAGDISEVAVLPKYDRIVLDEAHNLEDVASRYFGVAASYGGIQRALGRLYRVRRNQTRGLLPGLLFSLNQNTAKIPRDIHAGLQERVSDKTIPAIDKAGRQLADIMQRLFYWVQAQNDSSGREAKLRISKDVAEQNEWKELTAEIPFLLKALEEVTSEIRSINEMLLKIKTSFMQHALSMSTDLKAQADRILQASQDVAFVLLEEDDRNVRWLETREGRFGPIVHLLSAPIEVAPILKNAVFDRFPTVVMTSATLSVAGKFGYFEDRLGLATLADERRQQIVLSSPFAYREQAMLTIPDDMPEPNSRDYESSLGDMLLAGIRASSGSAIVLFTSYALLNRMVDRLEHALAMEDIHLYRQGKMNRHQLLQRFREDIRSVLFATDSFWEGIDVQGDALVHVLMPRLPFRVPNEPVIKARIEAIEQRGGNSFMEYSVPQAVLKFKQGFGRLIRTTRDYGAVTILDRRVITKRYGRMFLESLPDCRMAVGRGEDVMAEVERFLTAKRAGDPTS